MFREALLCRAGFLGRPGARVARVLSDLYQFSRGRRASARAVFPFFLTVSRSGQETRLSPRLFILGEPRSPAAADSGRCCVRERDMPAGLRARPGVPRVV